MSDPSETDESRGRGRTSGAGCLVYLLFLLPVLYVLSLGPVVWIASRMPPGFLLNPVLAAFYAPLEWLVDNNVQPFGPLIVWYADLFR